MPAEKISISLPQSLAGRIDELAAHDGVTRSFLIQEAAAQYVASREAVERHASIRASIASAIAGFDEIARNWGEDERSVLDYLAEIRGEVTGGAK